MTISYGLRADLSKLLPANETTNAMLAQLDLAGKNTTLLQGAWLLIIQQLNSSYYIARDNTAKFHSVIPVIDALADVTQTCVKQFNGEIADNAILAEAIAQLHFKVSNYYSLASTLDEKNYDKCSQWLKDAGTFIQNNGLAETKTHAIWHNLIGGHESRGFEMGLFAAYPHSCVMHFQEAVRIHNEKLGSKLGNAADVELRHVLMCLANVICDEAINKLLSEEFTPEEIDAACDTATRIVDQLSDDVLVYKDGAADHYRRAGCWQVKSHIALLSADFTAALTAIKTARDEMLESLAVTNATGQLSAIENDVANTYIAMATVEALEAKRLSQGNLEDMYGKKADRILTDLAANKFSQLATIIVNNLTLAHADKIQVKAGPAFTPSFETLASAEAAADKPSFTLKYILGQ